MNLKLRRSHRDPTSLLLDSTVGPHCLNSGQKKKLKYRVVALVRVIIRW